MSASFRRRAPVQSPTMPGTKAWNSGTTLVSTGLRELDTIVGAAGQPLGTALYVVEDRWTGMAYPTVVSYWCSEVGR